MRICDLIEHLKMFGNETEVYVQTTPDDLCQPITRKLISVIPARHDERYGLSPHKVLLTAFIPHDWEKTK